MSYDCFVVDNSPMVREQDVSKVLGPLEAEVMAIMWAAKSPVSVRDVLNRLNSKRRDLLAYTTVMTVMGRLAEKRILQRRPRGRGFIYEAAVPDAAGIAVREVMRDFGEAALAQFIDEARADPKLLRRLERLLADER